MKRLFFLFLALCAAGKIAAQQEYTIYPVPQTQQLTSGQARFTDRVNIIAEPGIDAVTVARAEQVLAECGLTAVLADKPVDGQSNLLIGVNGSHGVADSAVESLGLDRSVFSQPKYDRHIVSLTADGSGIAQLLVLGENTDAAFCGLATVEQMLDRGTENLPCANFFDYADIRARGVIEGYYGVPYNAEVTKDLFRFMARYKMNTYMYGAKSDPYHTRYWDVPYPTEITPEQQRIGYLTQDMLRDIVSVAHASKVNFIWAIHPGTAFTGKDSTDVIDRIMTKFQSMYDLGVRQFGLFVDDVGVPYDRPSQALGAKRLTQLQNSIDKRWNTASAKAEDKVKPLQYVPQLYAYSWTTPDKAAGFFKSLSRTPAKIDIYITGAKVWSVPNSRDLELVSNWLGRDVAWWWNYPCNDNDMTKLFPMDIYTNFRDEKHIANDARLEPSLKGTATLIANPMQQGETSKIALFSVGDYAWNNAAFDYMRSWESSLPAVVGKKRAEALKRVLPYLRYYDEDTLTALVEDYKQSVAAGTPRPDALIEELSDVLRACCIVDGLAVSASESDRLFYEDMRPWMDKLETMLQMTLNLLCGKDVSRYPDLESDATFQFEVLTGLGDGITLDVKTAEPCAKVLRPFIDWLQEQHD